MGTSRLRRELEDASLSAGERQFLAALKPVFTNLLGAEQPALCRRAPQGSSDGRRVDDELGIYRPCPRHASSEGLRCSRILGEALDPEGTHSFRVGGELAHPAFQDAALVGADLRAHEPARSARVGLARAGTDGLRQGDPVGARRGPRSCPRFRRRGLRGQLRPPATLDAWRQPSAITTSFSGVPAYREPRRDQERIPGGSPVSSIRTCRRRRTPRIDFREVVEAYEVLSSSERRELLRTVSAMRGYGAAASSRARSTSAAFPISFSGVLRRRPLRDRRGAGGRGAWRGTIAGPNRRSTLPRVATGTKREVAFRRRGAGATGAAGKRSRARTRPSGTCPTCAGERNACGQVLSERLRREFVRTGGCPTLQRNRGSWSSIRASSATVPAA